MISGSLLPVTLYTTHLINSWVGQRDDENYCWHVNWWIGDCFFGNYGHGVKNWNSHSHKQHYCSSHFVLFKTQSRKQTFSSQNPWKSITKPWCNLGERSLRLGPVYISAYIWVWRSLRLPRVRFFSPPVSTDHVTWSQDADTHIGATCL